MRGDDWRRDAKGIRCRQGYLLAADDCLVRVRTAGERACLTIKGQKTGLSCPEYEYEIPLQDANDLLECLCRRPFIEKVRYRIVFGGMIWEIDVFEGENKGLVIAEVELTEEDQGIELPEWTGREVSLDPKYWNVNLMKNPYSRWSPKEKTP